MSDVTPRLGLPWLMPAQAQKHVTVNEALGRLDLLVQASVISRSQTLAPDTPQDGAVYLVPEGASGAWSEAAPGVLAGWLDGAWTFIPPWAGLGVYIQDEAAYRYYDGAHWRALSAAIAGLSDLTGFGLGAAPDAQNAFVARTASALWTAAETGDLRMTLNKSAQDRTVSMVFQSNWSGRAEMGLAGQDLFSIKVSSDGQSWREAVVIDPVSGRCRLEGLQLHPVTAPASSSAEGQPGEVRWDDAHIYVCIAQNQWRRTALSAW